MALLQFPRLKICVCVCLGATRGDIAVEVGRVVGAEADSSNCRQAASLASLDATSMDMVSCGSHNASSCSECDHGLGEHWCNGDCKWCRVECIHKSEVCEATVVCPDPKAKRTFYSDETVRSPIALFERLRANPWGYNLTVLSEDPWIIQFDNFLSEEECDAMIAGCKEGFTPDVTINEGRSKQKYRNSSSWNCGFDSIYTKERCSRPAMKLFLDRAAEVMGVGLEHAEGLSILKYLPGGRYGQHHDLLSYSEGCGPRVVTSMAYLSDTEDGGHTSFFHLGVRVQPKRGRYIIWPDTGILNRHGFLHSLVKNERTAHEAEVVTRGVKYTATIWWDQSERTANTLRGCCN